MEEFDKLRALGIECKNLSERMTEIYDETRDIINSLDLTNRCFIINKSGNYEVLVKYLSKVPFTPQEDRETYKYSNLEYNIIKITKYSNSDGTIEYGISNTTDYVCSDKLINEITEEEFTKIFTDVTEKISNFLEENTL